VQIKDDEQILAQAIQGDSEAFGILYERYVERIYNYIYYRTGNPYDAEDLTERVFTRALRHIGNYHHRGLPLSAWLYRIAHNLVANWHRDNSRRREIPLDEVIAASHQVCRAPVECRNRPGYGPHRRSDKKPVSSNFAVDPG